MNTSSPTAGTPLACATTTVSSAEQARALAQAVLDARLAACVQIEPIASLYHWDGRVCDEPEQRLTFKTTATALPALQALVLAQHPYQLPQFVVWPVEASADYAAWVAGAVTR